MFMVNPEQASGGSLTEYMYQVSSCAHIGFQALDFDFSRLLHNQIDFLSVLPLPLTHISPQMPSLFLTKYTGTHITELNFHQDQEFPFSIAYIVKLVPFLHIVLVLLFFFISGCCITKFLCVLPFKLNTTHMT